MKELNQGSQSIAQKRQGKSRVREQISDYADVDKALKTKLCTNTGRYDRSRNILCPSGGQKAFRRDKEKQKHHRAWRP